MTKPQCWTMRIEFVTLAVACAAALFAACLLGSTPMEVERVMAALVGGGDAGDRLVVMQIRLPRALTAFAVGVALGTSGAALQGLLRNPLAEPGVLGISAMASLGATGALYYGFAAVSAWAMPRPRLSARSRGPR